MNFSYSGFNFLSATWAPTVIPPAISPTKGTYGVK